MSPKQQIEQTHLFYLLLIHLLFISSQFPNREAFDKNLKKAINNSTFTCWPVGICFASFTLAKLPLPIVLIRR